MSTEVQMRSRRPVRRLAATLAMLTGALIGLALTTSPAEAAGTSYIYTQPGASPAIALCQSGGCGNVGDPIFPQNGVHTTMQCWADAGNYTGNYTSNRYFHVTIQGMPGVWFIHSSYVYYQTSVGRCA
jgi:hypothetical protein